MTEENRNLLLIDLCARLPYGVVCKITTIKKEEIETLSPEQVGVFKRNNCKIYPYLRPMSSMTDEEKEELFQLMGCGTDVKRIDFYISHHFDYRGLIEKGLALEVTKENNPYE